MKYLIEIDGSSEKGAKLLKYIWELNAAESDIRIISEPPLTDEEMTMPPTRKVTQTTLDAWLEPKDEEEGFTVEESKEYIRKKLERMREKTQK